MIRKFLLIATLLGCGSDDSDTEQKPTAPVAQEPEPKDDPHAGAKAYSEQAYEIEQYNRRIACEDVRERQARGEVVDENEVCKEID